MALSFVEPGLFEKALQNWPFNGLDPLSYGFIMADPPWRFNCYSEEGEEKSPQAHYKTMTLEEIAALPVADLAKPDCLLWLWATAPMLPEQIAIAEAWGFTFKTSGVWVKTTKNAKIAFGTGYILRNAHEPFIIATRGSPKTTASVRSVVMGALRKHSQKPEEAYAAAQQLMPGVRRASLFERIARPEWDGWGDEYGLPIETKKQLRAKKNGKQKNVTDFNPIAPALI